MYGLHLHDAPHARALWQLRQLRRIRALWCEDIYIYVYMYWYRYIDIYHICIYEYLFMVFICMTLLTRALSGNNVNFGVFALYGGHIYI